jgi:acetyltransferase-like isoleucine patch superfamily enzyme
MIPRRLREWLHREILTVVEAERRRIRIHSGDALREFEENRASIAAQLADAANLVGREVMMGRDVVIAGGRFAGGVGLELHDFVRVYDDCRLMIDQIGPTSGIVLEERVSLNFGCYIDGSGGVRIGRRTILGPGVTIVSSGHRVEPGVSIQASGKTFARVDVGADVWVGAHAVVRMGMTIGDGAVIGAGAIVTRDVAPGAIVAGNPAKPLHRTDIAPGSTTT